MIPSKFIKICGAGDDLCALDAEGQVWIYVINGERYWKKLTNKRKD